MLNTAAFPLGKKVPEKTDWPALGYILACVLMTVFGQIVIKWRVSTLKPVLENAQSSFHLVARAVFDPYIMVGLMAAFCAAGFWILALSRNLPLSYAYPFTSLSFVLILIASVSLFAEPLTLQKTLGVLLIMVGIGVSASSPG